MSKVAAAAAKAARPANTIDWPSVLADPVKPAMGELVGCGPIALGKKNHVSPDDDPRESKGQLTILMMHQSRPGRHRMGSARM